MIINKEHKDMIDALLNDQEFRKIVQDDIGKVRNVEVDWEHDIIRFYGEKSNASILISETLVLLKNQMH